MVVPFRMEKEEYLWRYSIISKRNFLKITLPFDFKPKFPDFLPNGKHPWCEVFLSLSFYRGKVLSSVGNYCGTLWMTRAEPLICPLEFAPRTFWRIETPWLDRKTLGGLRFRLHNSVTAKGATSEYPATFICISFQRFRTRKAKIRRI